MYRDEIFLILNKHTGDVDFAQNRKNQMILEKFWKFRKSSEKFGKIQKILEKIWNFRWKNEKKGKFVQGKLSYRLK